MSPTADELRKLYRAVAMAVHPDLGDELEKEHRHQLMADANQAYRKKDFARLKAILLTFGAETFESSPGTPGSPGAPGSPGSPGSPGTSSGTTSAKSSARSAGWRSSSSNQKPKTKNQKFSPIFTNALGMTLTYILPGHFSMGSPANEKGRESNEARHRVTLTRGFYMGVTPVTQRQWLEMMNESPSRFQGENLPVEKVSWHDAVAFCRELSQHEGREYRLPTEAEWEYACRAGMSGAHALGERVDETEAARRVNIKSGQTLHEVGKGRANAWGLHDMYGNVWQWCNDWYGLYQEDEACDPRGPEKGESRVVRGGAWSREPRHSRSAIRGCQWPEFRFDFYGLRVVRELGE